MDWDGVKDSRAIKAGWNGMNLAAWMVNYYIAKLLPKEHALVESKLDTN